MAGMRPLIIIEWGSDMDAKQVRAMIRRVLHYLEPEIRYSEDAVELLMLTAAQESHLGQYLAQLHGPARGIYQMEPASEQCLMEWLMEKRPDVHAKIKALNLPLDGQDGGPGDNDMYHNLAYQTAMARAFYLRKPGTIPQDLTAAALYYKTWWNTHLGKATPQEAIANYQRYAYPLT